MQIDIKQPCSANWETMKIGINSRHCENCQKDVVDFTQMNRKEILTYLIEHSDDSVCGRINPQLVDVHLSDLPFIVNSLRKKSNNASFGILAALCLSLVACQETTSPHPEKHKQSITKQTKGSLANSNTIQKSTKTSNETSNKKKQQIIRVVEPEIMGEISILPSPEPREPLQYLVEPPIDIPIIETKQPLDSIYQFPTKSPEFPGGMDQLFQYLKKNLKYPESAKELGMQGTVFIEFVVRKSGEIDNIKLLRGIQGGQELDKEAIRLVKYMPKWNSGAMNGIPVSTMMRLPIKFRLD